MYILITVLLVLVVWVLMIKGKKSINLDGVIEHEIPILTLPSSESNMNFADSSVSGFDPETQSWNNQGCNSDEAPQLSETEIDTPEYKRQMKSLIEYLMRAGYKTKIINDYVNHIKDKFLSPQLILMQLKNDHNAQPPNISSETQTG